LPGQTVNVDICFIPVAHPGQVKLPAVSGSSGHLVIESVAEPSAAPTWPGQVFGDENLDYTSAMAQYVAETGDRLVPQPTPRGITVAEPALWRTEMEIRAARYAVRQQRKREDQAWRAAKSAWRTTRENRKALGRAAYTAAEAVWKQCRQERHATMARRKTENQAWHAQVRAAQSAAGGVREWIAVLLIIDNCTRQCLGLPAFTSGAHLTSAEVIAALPSYLPPELAFLISDQGTHFRAKAFARFAEETEFTHVLVYRHRPESNGIAERLVRTLKEWLREAAWETPAALAPLLTAFQEAYNARPHQGLPTPGLSPNEFAARAALM